VTALEKTEYLNKIEELFLMTETYEKINKDPTKKLTNEIREVLRVWKKKGYITDNTYIVIRFIVAMGIYHVLMGYLRSTN